ncbi:hypothetical protein Nepgr_009128 [Nepenthes gracilis]|uniref:X8 domain-containing protein n=1 Tax=Nepenthes gracilis TaxID=150966 RepID=A0AAD3XJV8_NEPGR|nr:hypothetical protein Nepgr_009128 [Nepenthes gracilis]
MANFIGFSLFCSITLAAAAAAATSSEASMFPPLRRPIEAENGGGVVVQQLWCVAKNNAEDSALQAALDWACGPGGSDCGAIQQGGPCYDPSDLLGMASYAFNDYCLKHGMTDDSCNFSNTAALTSLDPSHDNCEFQSRSSSVDGNSSGSSTVPGTDPSSADDMSRCSQLGAQEVRMSALLFFAIVVIFP